MNWNKRSISTATIIISLISLLGFLVYWNVSNYNSAKSQLQEDLEIQMKLAVAEYNDTLMVEIFNLAALDTFFESSYMVFYEDNDSISSQVQEPHENENFSIQIFDKNKPKRLMHLDTDQSDSAMNDQIHISIDTLPASTISKIIDTKSLNDVTLEVDDKGRSIRILGSNKWSRTKSYFDQNLRDQKLPNNYIEADSNNVMNSNQISLQYISSGSGPVEKNLLFSDFQSYLLKQQIPSAIVSSLLFLLVGLSFWLMRRTALEQVKLANIKSEFVANMTHELKTPISTVGVALEALKKFGAIEDPVKTYEYIDISQRELSRLQLLIDKVLKMSSLDQDIALANLEPVNMKKVVSNVISSLKLYMEENKVEYNIDEEGVDFIVDGDIVHLTNVIYNLVDNAVKYGGETPELNISIIEHTNSISIDIKDKGIGISADYHSKLFDRFFRVPKRDIHDIKGHGLGLNYVKTVIEKLGGTVSVKSKENEGSIFTLVLPKSNS